MMSLKSTSSERRVAARLRMKPATPSSMAGASREVVTRVGERAELRRGADRHPVAHLVGEAWPGASRSCGRGE